VLLLCHWICWLGLVYLPTQRHPYTYGNSAEISYALNVELKWVATDENADFALVQDTLSYYAAAFGSTDNTHSSEFRLDHCCGDLALREMLDQQCRLLSAAFRARVLQIPLRGSGCFRGMIAQGYLRPGKDGFPLWLGKWQSGLDLAGPPSTWEGFGDSRFGI
jgi:hypothetical protein